MPSCDNQKRLQTLPNVSWLGGRRQKPSLVEDTQVYPKRMITLFFSEVLGRGEGHADPDKGKAECQHVGWVEGRGAGEGVL